MMSDDRNTPDTFRQRNLEHIGRVLSLPPQADAQRQARWQSATLKTDWSLTDKGVRLMKAHKRFAFLTSGAAAAAIALVVWLGAGNSTPVSAASIFNDFKAAVQKALSIRMEGIDLGTVSVNGEMVLNRSPDEAADDTMYAEVHVLLKADNPEWNDLDAVIVICQTPDAAWQYCRGNGGSSAGDQHVEPTEYLVKGEAWSDFVEQPLEHFGSMPSALGFSNAQSGVTYRFTEHQRRFVERLLRFLMDICRADNGNELIDGLRFNAERIEIEQTADGGHTLRVFGPDLLGTYADADAELPDFEPRLDNVVWNLNYDTADRSIIWWSTSNVPGEFSEFGVGLDTGSAEDRLPAESLDALLGHFESEAHEVKAEQTGETVWSIRVVGYPFSLDKSSREWWKRNRRMLIENMTLSIHYDAKAGAVTRAEFQGVGCPDGRIILELGRVELDPERLSPDYWITERTRIDDWSD